MLNPTPFYDTDVLAVTNATAKKYGLKSIADLKKVGAFKLGGFPECQTRNTCFVGYTKQYGLSNATFASVGSVSPYAALDSGSVLAADVFSTDPPLAAPSKYTVLTDPKHITGFQNVAPIVKSSVASAAGSSFTSTVNSVSSKLTLPAIMAMNKAVIIDKKIGRRGGQAVPAGERARLVLEGRRSRWRVYRRALRRSPPPARR